MSQWIGIIARASIAWLIAIVITFPVGAASMAAYLLITSLYLGAKGDMLLGLIAISLASIWVVFAYICLAILPTSALGVAALALRREADSDIFRYILPNLLLICAALISAYLYSYNFPDYRIIGSEVLGLGQGLTFMRCATALFVQVAVFLMAFKILDRFTS